MKQGVSLMESAIEKKISVETSLIPPVVEVYQMEKNRV
jgi:hypothetical protein